MDKKNIFIIFAIFMIFGSINVFGAITDFQKSYYSFNGNALDYTGKSNGTIYSASLVSGILKQAYNFSGSASSYINSTSLVAWNSSGRTISLWIKATTISAGYHGLYYEYNGALAHAIYIDNTGKAVYYGGTGTQPVTSVLSVGVWYHIVATYDGSRTLIYLNGSLQGNTSQTWASGNVNSLYIGNDGGSQAFNGIIDEVGTWNRVLSQAEIIQLYNSGLGFNPYDLTNNSLSFNGSGVPANLESFNQSFMNFSQLAYFTNNSVNCSLILNGVLNETKTYTNLTNQTYAFNITFNKVFSPPKEINWSISCKSLVDNVTYNSSTQTFYLDIVYPTFVTNFVNGSFYYSSNLSAQFNFSDDFYLNSFNISIDGVQVAGNDTLTGNFSQFNFSRNISNLSSGSHVLTIRTSDGHTAHKIPDYDVSNGLLNNYLQYGYENNGRKNVKISTDSVLDTFSTKKQLDRYTFDFQPYDTNKPFYEFNIETDEPIRVIEDDSTYLKAWITFGNKWLDFYIPGENATIKITKVSDKYVKVRVSGLKNKGLQKYQSIGDLNIYVANYTFYKVNASAVAQAVVFEGSTTSLTLNVTTTNISGLNTSAYLVWAGRYYSASKTNISENVTQFYSSFIATNSTNPTNWTWFFNVSSYPFNLSGASNYTAMNITNCSAGSSVVLNYTIYDEELQTPESTNTTNATIENYLTIQNPSDLSYSYNFTIKQPSYNLLICFPNGIMNQSSWILNALTKYEVTDHVQEFHYIENFNLTNAQIPKNIGLYDLQSSKSTSFLITYQDENYLYVEGVVVDLLRKYISQSGQFYSIEHAKTDSGGQTRLHFVTEDVIYKANVWQNGELLYTTGEFQALCQATPCQINLRKPYENTEGISQLENIVYSMTPQNQFHTGKSVTFSFSTKDGTSTTILMNVTRSTTLTNETICSQSTTTSAGSVVCAIPLTYQNATYLARVYMDGEILGFRSYTDEPSAKETFGDTGVFLSGLAYLMLAFMGISSPIVSIVLGILGLIFMGGMMMMDGMTAFGVGSTLLWLIIAGGILIWKFTQRRVQ